MTKTGCGLVLLTALVVGLIAWFGFGFGKFSEKQLEKTSEQPRCTPTVPKN
jgi:hypothetical protein